jgi:uncharacterized damage-inducible protein DinB
VEKLFNVHSYLSSFAVLFDRDLGRLAELIKSYPEDEQLWTTPGEISNSAGHLCLHVCGNLRHFLGAVLNNEAYTRDREREFHSIPVDRTELLQAIQITQQTVRLTFQKLDPIKLEELFPVQVFDKPMTTLQFMTHLYGHLNYHLGQASYHQKMQQRENGMI